MRWPWSKQPQQRRKLSGMANKKQPIQKSIVSVVPKMEIPDSWRRYLTIVSEDIKYLFGMDKKSVEDRQIYSDFMEQHFGKN